MSSLSISKILLPVDFSPRAEDAVRYAVPLARRLDAEFVLLHVLEPLHADFAMAELPDALLSLAQAHCDRAKLRLERLASSGLVGVRTQRKIVHGHPADEILAVAEGVDLVVMPTQGHGRIREFLIGSVTAKVLHDCDKPVLTGVHLAPNSAFPDFRVDKVLCAIDFGPECAHVLDWGKRMANEFGSEVIVVHAGCGPEVAPRLKECVHASGLKGPLLIAPGEPHEVVANAAGHAGADLVIIGRGSNAGTLGRLRGQAYQIVRKSPCPVLSV